MKYVKDTKQMSLCHLSQVEHRFFDRRTSCKKPARFPEQTTGKKNPPTLFTRASHFHKHTHTEIKTLLIV